METAQGQLLDALEVAVEEAFEKESDKWLDDAENDGMQVELYASSQEELSASSAYCPGGQSTQKALPSCPSRPASQAMHTVPFADEYFPSVHSLQRFCPLPMYLPGGHATQPPDDANFDGLPQMSYSPGLQP